MNRTASNFRAQIRVASEASRGNRGYETRPKRRTPDKKPVGAWSTITVLALNKALLGKNEGIGKGGRKVMTVTNGRYMRTRRVGFE
jgi:hypothetical protein